MSNNITYYLVIMILLLAGCGQKPITSGGKNLEMLIFVDGIDETLNSFFDFVKEPVERYLIRNIDGGLHTINISIYVLDAKTDLGNPLLTLSVSKEDALKIRDLDRELNKTLKKANNNLYESLQEYENKNEVIRIIPSTSIIREKLLENASSQDAKELCIIYISDLFELHFPADEKNGYFCFMKEGTQPWQLESYSINSARSQIKDSTSWIYKNVIKVNAFHTDSTHNNSKVYVFRPGHFEPQPDLDGTDFSKVKMFWSELFDSLGLPINIKSLREVKSLEL